MLSNFVLNYPTVILLYSFRILANDLRIGAYLLDCTHLKAGPVPFKGSINFSGILHNLHWNCYFFCLLGQKSFEAIPAFDNDENERREKWKARK